MGQDRLLDAAPAIAGIDAALLEPIVRRALGRESARVTDWTATALSGGFESVGVFRVTGHARDGNTLLPWSVILKLTCNQPGVFGSTDDLAFGRYWKREALLFKSGILDDLPPGLSAPTCYRVEEPSHDTAWIWLKDIADEAEAVWSLDRYGQAARHLGQFNGAYLAGRAIPSAPWLTRRRLRDYFEAFAPSFELFPTARTHPLIRHGWSDELLDRVQRLLAERDVFYRAIERLPTTFCHQDAFRGNLLTRRGLPGGDKTVAIDWEFSGLGAIGEELSSLIAGSVFMYLEEPERMAAIDGHIFAGYLDGLRDAGWTGDSRLARLGYTASAAVHFVTSGMATVSAVEQPFGAYLEQLFGRPLQEILDRTAIITEFLCDQGDEARGLIDQLGLP